MCVLNEQNRHDQSPVNPIPIPIPNPSPANTSTRVVARVGAVPTADHGSLRLVKASEDAPRVSLTEASPTNQLSVSRAVAPRLRPWKSSEPPTAAEIAQAIDAAKFPPILTPEQAAELLQLAPNTLYKHVSQGKYKQAVRRGNPLRFWRDRLIQAFFAA